MLKKAHNDWMIVVQRAGVIRSLKVHGRWCVFDFIAKHQYFMFSAVGRV